MELDYQEDKSPEEPLGFALGAAARKLAKVYTQAYSVHTMQKRK